MKSLFTLVALAAVGFFIMFSPWTQDSIPFWTVMSLTAATLGMSSIYLDRRNLKTIYHFRFWHLLAGIVSAALLYAVFWIGHFISTRILPFAAGQVESIYQIREGQNPLLIAALLIFIIGPAEEIFWRGFVQRRLSQKYGLWLGLIIAAAFYTIVHIWSFNLMLIAAAGICGVFWCLLFALTKNLWPCIISHILWDITIFLLLPIK